MGFDFQIFEDDRLSEEFAEWLVDEQSLGDSNGRVLIVQDKFSKPLLKRIARKIGQNCYKAQLRQQVYSKENSNDFQSYVYYYCLFAT